MNTPGKAAPCESNSLIRLQDVVTMGIVVENPAPVTNASVPRADDQSVEPANRIVPKSKYVRAQGRRASMGGAGMCLFGLAVVILSAGFSIGCSRYDAYQLSIVDTRNIDLPTRAYSQPTFVPGRAVAAENVPNLSQIELPERSLAMQPEWWVQNVCLLLLFSALIYACARIGLAFFRQVETIDPGVPLTRANTGHLPVQESLVRAACEPAQQSPVRASISLEAKQEELLRPVRYSREAHEEQLVRPAE